MSRYAKALVALIPVLITGLNTLLDVVSDEVVTQQEWIALVVAVVTAIGVYVVPNTPPAGQAANPNISERGPRL